MSIFGYPAEVTHYMASVDSWGRVTGFVDEVKAAKVVEKQRLIRNAKGEEVQSIAEIHLEGANKVTVHDYFEHVNEFDETVKYEVLHYEIRKEIGSDDVKKVVVYG